ncbi:hypothetical protein HT105_22360, partial [Bacteroides fragilis]|nr:hypothetical protein [Bacteroides fragilis]
WVSTYEREFTKAYNTLGVLPPSVEPRATGFVTQMVDYMQRLYRRRLCLRVSDDTAGADGAGSVYFDVQAWVAAEGSDYGSLSGNRVEEMEQGEDPEALKRGKWVSTYEREFTKAYNTLGVLPPSVEPRATGFVT